MGFFRAALSTSRMNESTDHLFLASASTVGTAAPSSWPSSRQKRRRPRPSPRATETAQRLFPPRPSWPQDASECHAARFPASSGGVLRSNDDRYGGGGHHWRLLCESRRLPPRPFLRCCRKRLVPLLLRLPPPGLVATQNQPLRILHDAS